MLDIKDCGEVKWFLGISLSYVQHHFILPLYSPDASFATSFTLPTSHASADLWHRRLGHPSLDTIKHLPLASRGVSLSSPDFVS